MATSGALSTSNTNVKYTISIVENNYSIASNTSNVTVSVRFYRTNTGYTTYGTGTVYCKINGITYSASVVPTQYITESGIVLFTKTLDIAHNTDGTKTLTCSAWISHNAPLTSSEQSYSLALTTIPRKSTLSASNGTLGTAQTLTVARKSTSFTHTITYACGSASGTICTKLSNTSISWTPPLSLASQNTTGTSVSVALIITTYNGDTWVGENTYYITCYIPESVKPTVSISVSDPTGYLATYGGYVQGRSKFKIVITASGSYGSSISWYSTSADGKGYSEATIETNVINGSGTLTISTTVADSRGRTASVSTTVTVLPYSTPKITAFSIARCDGSGNASNSGEYLKVLFSAEISALNKKNTFSYKVQYKKSTESSYTGNTVDVPSSMFAISDVVYVFRADTSATYDVVLEIADKFSITKKTGIGSSIEKILSVKGNGKGIGIGKPAELDDYLDVAYKTRFRDNATVEGNAEVDGILQLGKYVDKETTFEGGIKIHDLRDVDVTPSTFGDRVMNIYSDYNDSKRRYEARLSVKGWDKDHYTTHELAFDSTDDDNHNELYHRVGRNGAWEEWKTLLDSSNYTNYAVSKSIYGKNKVLWSGGWHMNGGQTATLSEAISAQVNGIVLIFSLYNVSTGAVGQTFNYAFIPKYFVSALSGQSSNFPMVSSQYGNIGHKMLYINNTQIVGHAANDTSGTTSGVTYNNANFILRYVIGV